MLILVVAGETGGILNAQALLIRSSIIQYHTGFSQFLIFHVLSSSTRLSLGLPFDLD